MSLSNHEQLILAQLELSFGGDDERLKGIERRTLRRQALTTVIVPVGLLSGFLLVVIGVGLSSWAGNLLAVVGYSLLVASGNAGVLGTRRFRTARRAGRPQSRV